MNVVVRSSVSYVPVVIAFFDQIFTLFDSVVKPSLNLSL